MLFLTVTQNIPPDALFRYLESASASFLGGIIAGAYFSIKILDIPDKLQEVNKKLDQISIRQRILLNTLNGKKSDDFESE
jgi:t-SNARE complex subunit (syntaxin)